MARKFSAFSIATVAMAMLALSAVTVPTNAHAQQSLSLKRVASQFTAFDGTFIDVDDAFTDSLIPVSIFANSAIKVPGGSNFAYITLNASASGQCGGIAFNCKIDGANCNGGFNPSAQGFENPLGFITLAGNSDSEVSGLHGSSSFGPTNISYTWCTPLVKTKKNLHEVIINAAQDTFDNGVSFCTEILSAVSVFIDVNNVHNKNFIDNACTSYVNPNEF